MSFPFLFRHSRHVADKKSFKQDAQPEWIDPRRSIDFEISSIRREIRSDLFSSSSKVEFLSLAVLYTRTKTGRQWPFSRLVLPGDEKPATVLLKVFSGFSTVVSHPAALEVSKARPNPRAALGKLVTKGWIRHIYFPLGAIPARFPD